ncbi:MAG: hypothetical protein GTO45_35425 [Candidatus Aminicenantes bacterium]|nr:hypothetical protein [Candidatus Aminicenantes bacterium]NIM83971.1 hypothetical protein [Candidatus Aminicenantes bacterium]NIN23445.1 hypothetical protein [Candidatus Aminicenantes bacterium]NIN47150.1 hypothetical protein [Candidatus Aminicenantes bacterium]NIN90074.1 hypothetical protein [Candidatus Aminicenantes bacterium]
MSKRIKLVLLVIGVIISSLHFIQAVELQENGKIIIPDRTIEPIKIDGDLSEAVWSKTPVSKDFMTYVPIYGQVLSKKTEVWMAYDNYNLYFAFKCYDNEPTKIKTSISPRDKISRDDWVAVLLDAMGIKQTSYEFYVNPSGIQLDALNSAVGGWDMAPDFVWESAGKITGEGYQVEIAIPLESIRFKSGKEVQMGILLLRNITRVGTAGTWPEVKPGQTDFNFMATIIYTNLKPRLKLEVLPNFTYNRNVERERTDEWEKDTSQNIGASIKYGITSSITAEATVNPDFSQVESDAFQVEVNRRYPIFYSEKRPFFMEGMEVFDFALISDGMFGLFFEGMMTSAVHTRHIVDPGWAVKLSGVSGKMSFAVLAANDRSEGQARENGINPNQGNDVIWGITRGKYNLGSDNSLGFLYSGRHFQGDKNNVVGIDLKYRFFKNVRLTVSYLSSSTKDSAGAEFKTGNGFNAMLQYLTPHFRFWTAYERYDEDFTLYSAFINRTNISRGMVFIMPDFHMKIKGIPWFRNIQPFLLYSKLHDLGTGMDDTSWRLGAFMNFTRRGLLILGYRNEKEAWLGQLYDQKFFYSWGRIQLFKWLFIIGSFRYGDQIYYGPEEPFLGRGHQFKVELSFQPNIKLNMGVELLHNVLYRKTNHQKFYTVDILNLQTTYHFNKYFFIRGVLRYNDYQKKLLTDLLASFTLIPGTVMHLGYGSLYENKEWQENRWVPGPDTLLNMKNGLFFKVSYLWRIK